MTILATSRRGMLGAIALAPIVATVATCAPQPAAAATSALPSMIAKWRVAEAECDLASDAHQAALDAWEAACEAVPHYTTTRGYQSKGRGFMHMTTADPTHAPSAHTVVEVWSGKEWADEAYLSCCRELIEADDRRQAEIARLKAVHGVQAASDEEERVAEISGDMLWAIIEHPVSTPDDLLAKLAFMTETGHFGDTDVTVAVGEDIRRVLKGRLS
jgi:hypothetical protein